MIMGGATAESRMGDCCGSAAELGSAEAVRPYLFSETLRK